MCDHASSTLTTPPSQRSVSHRRRTSGTDGLNAARRTVRPAAMTIRAAVDTRRNAVCTTPTMAVPPGKRRLRRDGGDVLRRCRRGPRKMSRATLSVNYPRPRRFPRGSRTTLDYHLDSGPTPLYDFRKYYLNRRKGQPPDWLTPSVGSRIVLPFLPTHFPSTQKINFFSQYPCGPQVWYATMVNVSRKCLFGEKLLILGLFYPLISPLRVSTSYPHK